MPNPLNLALHAVGQQRPQLVHGHVSSSKPAPALFTDPLYVVMPQWQSDYYWTITNWPKIHGNTLPAQGAECLLAYDDQRNLWCLSWSGTYS